MNIVYKIFELLGGLAIFMYGIKIMSDNIERVAGKNLKKMLAKVSNNRLSGVGIGAGVTSIIQSSSATTVMIVGFVNIGVMTLTQAAAVIMGANIGTTITLQITSLKDILNITAIAGFIAAAGVFINLFGKSNTLKRLGVIFIGLGMLFIGLDFMSAATQEFRDPLKHFFLQYNHPLLLILIGMIFTAIIQSSSAATVIVASFAASGAIGFESALFAVMGMNIGTCITAIISSIGTNVNAKRAAFIHLLFNILGVTAMVVAYYIIGYQPIESFLIFLSGHDVMRQIANFHTFLNIAATLLLLPFLNLLVKLSMIFVKGKATVTDGFRLYYLDERVLKTPPIAVSQMKKEVVNMLNLAKQNLDLSLNAVISVNTDRESEFIKREEEINFLNKSITSYLVKISALDIAYKDELIVSSYYHVTTDIERIGDHAENVFGHAKRMIEENITFSEEAKADIDNYVNILNNLYENTLRVFIEGKVSHMAMVNKYEDEADNAKHSMARAHIQRLNSGLCTAENGAIYLSLASNFERVADHLTNIAESVLTYTKD